MLIAAAAMMLLGGVFMGLLGGGGSILAVPVLTFVAALPLDEAIFTSLLVVAITSGLGAALRARRGQVRGQVAALLGGAGVAGAYAGGRLSAYVPERALTAAFALLTLVTALAMLAPVLRSRRAPPPEQAASAAPGTARASWLLLPLGASIGLVTGLVGVGGGFLIVPALLLVARAPMEVATGTSQLVICMQATAAVVAHASHAAIDLTQTGLYTAMSVAGLVLGTSAAARVPPGALRTGFGGLLLLVAVAMAARAW